MNNWRVLLGLIAVLSMLAAACGNSPEDVGSGDSAAAEEMTGGGDGSGADISGTIEIDGSSTVGPLTDAIAEEYASAQPNVTVNVGISGTGGGFERFCGAGDTDISNASRPIKEEEAAMCEENGIEFTEVRVGTDALTMVTNPQTDFLECLTTDEVAAIFGPDAVDTWDQVRPGFPAEPIEVFAPDTDSGTYDFMLSDILGVEESRDNYNASADDNIIAQGIQGTPSSWGFFGFAYYTNNADNLKAISYDAGEGCVEPSVETAQNDTYKMTRPLFIYVKNSALERPEVADFVTFYLENVGSIVESVGYIPAPEEALSEAQAKVEEAIGAAA